MSIKLEKKIVERERERDFFTYHFSFYTQTKISKFLFSSSQISYVRKIFLTQMGLTTAHERVYMYQPREFSEKREKVDFSKLPS